MHRTVEDWSRLSPSAVVDGSRQQAVNVLGMARDDIRSLGAALAAIMEAAENRDVDACHELARRALSDRNLMQPISKT